MNSAHYVICMFWHFAWSNCGKI